MDAVVTGLIGLGVMVGGYVATRLISSTERQEIVAWRSITALYGEEEDTSDTQPGKV